MYKNAETGDYEHDFRIDGLPRYRACYGPKKIPAERLHAVAVRVFKANDPELVFALKDRRATMEQYAQLSERGKPFADALLVVHAVEPWPELGTAVEMYLAATGKNPKKSDGTHRAAGTQLMRYLSFQDPATRLDAITTASVSEYQAALIAEPFEVNTVTASVWRVGTLFRWFIKQEATAAREAGRPARPLYVPIDVETISTAKTKRTRFLSVEEAQRLMAATPPQYAFPVACGLFAGFRVDEMIHLRAAFDVDMVLGTLAVQIHPQPGWKPKTPRSVRYVPISGALMPMLVYQLASRADGPWVTPSLRSPDKPLNRYTFDTAFQRIVEDAGLIPGARDPMGVTYHTLRHSFASWLLMAGVDMYTVAKLLGNTVKQVEDTYGHLSKDHRQRAVALLTGDWAKAEISATPSATSEAD